MADYDGGRVFLNVVPSFRGVQRAIAAEANSWGREAGREFQDGFDREVGRSRQVLGPSATESRKQGADAGGAFADGFKRRVEAAMRSLPPAKLKADATDAERSLRDLRLQLEELSGKTVGVDIDSGAALAELQRIDQQLDELGRESADVQVRADTGRARAELAAIQAQVDILDRDDINIDVHANTGFADASLNSFTGRLLLLATAGAAIAPAIVPAAGAAAVALAGIGAGAVAGLTGIGALAIALNGIGDAVKALGEAEASSADDAEAAGARRVSSANAVASAQRQVAQAEAGLANARANAADQAEDAARRIADAQEQVAEAQRAVNRATEDAARDVADAVRRQEDAERSLGDAQQATEAAQRDLTDARRSAQEQLEDLELATRAASLAEEDAELGLERAKLRLSELQQTRVAGLDEAEQTLARTRERLDAALADEAADPYEVQVATMGFESAQARLSALQAEQAALSSGASLEANEAELAVRQAQLRLDQARDRNEDTQEQARAAERAGVDGADAVRSAQERLERTRRNEADAVQAVTDAEAALVDTRVDGAERIEEAQGRVLDAQEAVTDAIRAQERQQRQSAFAIAGAIASVEGAQAALGAASASSAVEVSASAKAVEEAFAKLSPAGQQFAIFINGLRDELAQIKAAAEEGLFPGLTDGIQALLPVLPQITSLIGAFAGVMGTLARDAGESLASETWRPFFDYLAGEGPGILLQLGRSFGNLAVGLGNLIVAFAPLTEWFIDGFENMAESFAAWSASLGDSEGFQVFMDYVRDNSPVLLEFFSALGDLIIALVDSMAPFGPVVLQIATAFANMLAALPPSVLSALVLLFIGLTVVFNTLGPLIGIVSTFVTALSGGATILGAVIAALGGPFTLIIIAIVALGAALIAAYHHSETFRDVVDSVFRAVGDVISFVWNNVLRPIFDLYAWYFREVIGPAVMFYWREVVQPAFEGIGRIISRAWNEVIKPIFEALGSFIKDDVAPLFQQGVDAIGTIWDGLKDLAKAPVKFIIDTVINDGIIGAFNWMAGKIPGLPEISPVRIPGFATGGIYPGYTPGRDVGFIGVSGGEAIMRPEWTRAVGREQVEAMNAAARSGGVSGVRRYLGGFAGGGVADAFGGWGFLGDAVGVVGEGAGWVKDRVASGFAAAGDFVVGKLRQAAEATLRPIFDRLEEFEGGFTGDLIVGAARSALEGLLGYAGQKDAEVPSPGTVGDAPIAGSGFGALIDYMRGALDGGYVVTSTLRPGDDGYHGRGKAVDFSVGGHGNRGYGHPGLRSIFDALLPIAGNLSELILAGAPFNIKNGKQVGGYAWGVPGGKGNHWNHVHAALFDQGGRLPPGLSTVMNATGSPELVLNGQQEGMIEAVLRGKVTAGATAGGGVTTGPITVLDGRDFFREIEIQNRLHEAPA